MQKNADNKENLCRKSRFTKFKVQNNEALETLTNFVGNAIKNLKVKQNNKLSTEVNLNINIDFDPTLTQHIY